jgi:hypothetical protein
MIVRAIVRLLFVCLYRRRNAGEIAS